jgi:hypothetical protein
VTSRGRHAVRVSPPRPPRCRRLHRCNVRALAPAVAPPRSDASAQWHVVTQPWSSFWVATPSSRNFDEGGAILTAPASLLLPRCRVAHYCACPVLRASRCRVALSLRAAVGRCSVGVRTRCTMFSSPPPDAAVRRGDSAHRDRIKSCCCVCVCGVVVARGVISSRHRDESAIELSPSPASVSPSASSLSLRHSAAPDCPSL